MTKDTGTPELVMKREYMRQQGNPPDVFRVEQFERQDILTTEQAVAGKRLYVWHFAATREQGARIVDLTREVFARPIDWNENRMDAATKYFKTMTQIRAVDPEGEPYKKILRAVCIDEMSLNKLTGYMAQRKDSVRELMQEAFDVLVGAQQRVFELEEKSCL